MDDTPLSLQEMLRRALAAQVELGMGEMILPTTAMEREKTAFEQHLMAGNVTRTMDLFGSSAEDDAPQFESLEAHYQAVGDCQLCPLGQTRTRFVYGVGNPKANLMFIGEAPGREEDLQGEPFVGRAGQLLDRILAAIGFSREEVYIANILKCRPPDNRDPLPEEAEKCLPHLYEQIRLIRPKFICALGRVAGQILLKTNATLGKLRGQWHDLNGTPVMVTYHPAALLRSPGYKKGTWEDMQELRKRYDELVQK